MHTSANRIEGAFNKNSELAPSDYLKSEKKLSFIKAQIKNNVRDMMKEIISVKILDDSDTLIIKINLERATDDNFKVFNDFINSECDYSHKNYIIDLSKALFLDSTFLGCIVIFYKKISQKGKRFNLVIDKQKVKILQPFENLEKILNVKTSIDEAIEQK